MIFNPHRVNKDGVTVSSTFKKIIFQSLVLSSNDIIYIIKLFAHIYIYFIPTDDWVRPMKHFVLEEIYI